MLSSEWEPPEDRRRGWKPLRPPAESCPAPSHALPLHSVEHLLAQWALSLL